MLFAHLELTSAPAIYQRVGVTDVSLAEQTEWHLRDVLFEILSEAPKQSHKSAGTSFLIFLHFHCVVFIKED